MGRDYDKEIRIKFKDMEDSFANIKNVKGNPLIYKVLRKSYGSFETGITIIEPGNINGEYYHTRGHNHRKNGKEIYVLLEGEGKLLLEGKSSKVYNLNLGKIYTISGKAGHRLINTGEKRLRVLTIYPKGIGRSYFFKFKKKFFKNE